MGPFLSALSSHSRGSSRTSGGDDEARTHDPLLAKQVLSQLSYTPVSRFQGSKFTAQTLKIKQYLTRASACLHRQTVSQTVAADLLLRKEVIHPHVLVGMPCYDFTPITGFTLGSVLLAVRLPTSGAPDSHGVTGGVYKARERIHRGMLIRDY